MTLPQINELRKKYKNEDMSIKELSLAEANKKVEKTEVKAKVNIEQEKNIEQEAKEAPAVDLSANGSDTPNEEKSPLPEAKEAQAKEQDDKAKAIRREELQKILIDKNVAYDKRWGIERLEEIVNLNK